MPPLQQHKVILVVDDDQAIRENVAECLETDGYGCWLEASGDHALRRLDFEMRRPDAILLDLRMPGMTAEAFVRTVKLRPASRTIPVVLSTAVWEDEIPNYLTGAVNAILLKPFDVSRLLELIATIVGDVD